MHEQTGDREIEKKSAVVAVIGRPSVGKSTLMNRICGYKISIVTPVPQTTRNRVRGIYTDERGQLVFIDTPGYHNSAKKFNRAMRSLISEEVGDADVVLAVVDLSREAGAEEQALLEAVRPHLDRSIVALNKADIAARRPADAAASFGEFATRTVPVSAAHGQGVDDLVRAIFSLAPPGELMYPSEYYTDQEPTFRVAEVVREQAMLRTRDELPHALYVDVLDFGVGGDGECLRGRAVIYVERESQKGIVVGEGGKMIRAIRLASQKELGEIFERPVYLDLRVKVHPKWRQRDETIRKLVR